MVYQASFQDIFFILAGLVWVGYSAYRGSKKKGRASQGVTTRSSSKKDSLLEELLAAEYANEDAQQQETANFFNDPIADNREVQPEEILNDDHIFSYDDYYEEGVVEEQVAENTMPEQTTAIKANNNVNTPKENGVRGKVFDLRKAFIYSEILKRKYI